MKSTEEKKRELLNAPVGRMVFYLALPAVASMLVTALYNMADTYFVGRIDTVATGAVRKGMWNWVPMVLMIVPISSEQNRPCAIAPSASMP